MDKKNIKHQELPLYLALIIIATFLIIMVFLSISIRDNAHNIEKQNQSLYANINQVSFDNRKKETEININNNNAKAEEKHNFSQFKDTANLDRLNLNFVNLDIPLMYQYPELPNGCEAVALTNMLNYFGFNLSKTFISDNYIAYDDTDFVNAYTGNPESEDSGGSIMSPGVVLAANKFIITKTQDLYCYNVSGKDFKDLFAYIERGYPVQIWCSLYMKDLVNAYNSLDVYVQYNNSHSVLIGGFDIDNNKVYVEDSLDGHVSYPIEQVEDIYKQAGSQAIVVLPKKLLAGENIRIDDVRNSLSNY